MSAPIDPKLKRYIEGFTAVDEMQAPPGPDGDPQLAALTQYLHTLSGTVGPDDVILDLASGLGILAHALLRIWPADKSRPWYYAVDREPTIETLDLPLAIHNHSQKIRFGMFLAGRLPCPIEKIRVVVFRNSLHHLDIETTASVCIALRRIVQTGGQVYLQDIVSLPQGEHENVGWPPHLLREVVDAVGFECGVPAMFKSRSGTQWFTFILKEKGGRIPSLAQAAKLVANARERQRQDHTAKLAELKSGEDTLAEYFILNTEVASLGVQLLRYHSSALTAAKTEIIPGIPLLAFPLTPLDYAEPVPPSQRSRAGLRGILSSKRLIDLPTLLGTAHARLWFAGYSERLLFNVPEIKAALRNAAVERRVDTRILLVHPDSAAALARGVSEVYANPSDLYSDILTSVSGFAEFEREVQAASAGGPHKVQCELRLCRSILSSSFFFVDDLCICSLYSSNLTGATGAAFVFESSSVQPNNYFQVLLREYQGLWQQSDRQVSDRPPSQPM
jgi:ubiquinone/menaquinone biosynthesis C-methylase UbiE